MTSWMNTPDGPIARFNAWLTEAGTSEPNDPNAMTLATVNSDGMPSARMVLLKGVDGRGFTFYTNMGSRKAADLRDHPHAALCFHWKSLRRQIRVEGRIETVDDDEADAYFATRARVSQLGAWASKQSQPLRGRFELEARVAKFTARYVVGPVPRPPFWSGFRVVPASIEFWEDRPYRLHMRHVYRRAIEAADAGDGETESIHGGWTVEELYP